MTFIPDCRNDEDYNEDFLNVSGKNYIAGFDACTEDGVFTAFSNLDVLAGNDPKLFIALSEKLPEEEQVEVEYQDDMTGETVRRKLETYGDLLCDRLLDWIEAQRDSIITSLIESMDDAEYERIKAEAIEKNKTAKNPKTYVDTRKLFPKR